MTLRTRFLLYVGGLVVGSFGLYAGALVWTQKKFLVQEQERVNMEESSRWTLLCQQSVLSKDEITLVHYLRNLRGSVDVQGASFLAEDGRILMHSQLDLKNTLAVDSISAWALALDRPARRTFQLSGGNSITQKIQSTRHFHPQGAHFFVQDPADGSPVPTGESRITVYAGPVQRGGDFAGVALLALNDGRQWKRIRSSLLAALRRFAGVTLVCLAIGIGLAVGVARGLVSPLNELTSTVKRVGAGDWQARAAVHRQDEIGELATAFGEMSRQLARVDEMKDEFITTVSHDLRNPLGAITMAARYLKSPPRVLTPEMSSQVVDTILLSTARLKNMVDNILDAAKIKKGGLVSQRDPFSVSKVVGELYDLFRSQADEFGREFRLEAPETLPFALGDESQTYRLLCNLLSNAFKFTSSGDVVLLRAFLTQEGAIAMEVQDTGPGMAAKDLPTLFKRFQAGTIVAPQIKKQQGTGLGLSIAKALADAQGGALTVHSEENKGTLFRFTLPLWKAP